MPSRTQFRRCCLALLLSFPLSMLTQEAIGLTVTATGNPNNVQAGQTETLTATATTVDNQTNWSLVTTVSFKGVQVASTTYAGLTFTGGVPLTKTWTGQLATTTPVGTYTFTAKVFDELGNFLSSAQATIAITGPAVNGQHPTLLASYAKRPAWKVAGVDYAVGVPSMATLTDWQLLRGPGITVHATAVPPHVDVSGTSNVVISGVDFSLHGGAAVFFMNSPNPTVTNSKFGGTNLTKIAASVIYALPSSPGLTVSYNTIDGGGAGIGSSLVTAAGAGTTTLTYNWFKNYPQHVLEILTSPGAPPLSVIYKFNLIEQGGMQTGAHPNFLQFGTNSNYSSVDVEYNTSYQTRQVAGGEGYQFYDNGPNLIQHVTMAYNVMLAAGPPTAQSYIVHGGGSQNAGIAHDNYIDQTSSYGWLYPGSFTGWNVYNNYNMTTGAPF